MSYTLDVYRGRLKAARNPFDFALYVAYFPQLIAGPIERGTRLLPQILTPREVTLDKVYRGAYLFGWGLYLKVFVADNLARMVDPVFNSPGPYDGGSVGLAVYAFAIQIYSDFAGYSFMAIGMALAMGIELMENFRRPYFSRNISDFWRRWHISLLSWFRDYVFSPFYIYVEKWPWVRDLSLKARHAVAFFIALMVTEYLLGFWHGAGWNFGFFGLYHGLAIWAYYMVRKRWNQMNPYVQVFLTFQVACVGWLVFRAPTLGQAIEMLGSVFTNFSLAPELALGDTALRLIAFSGLLFVIQVFQDLKKETFVVLRLPLPLRMAVFVLLGVLVMMFGDFGDRPFIYFQF